MKATSIFGGVQVFNILISLIRSKVVAVLLGPAGMGIVGLLQTALGLVGAATNFGLGTSAVGSISEAHAAGDEDKIAHTTAVLRKLIWLTGLTGLTATAALAPVLSWITFGDYRYTWAFVALSLTLLLGQLASGQTVLLQGLRKIKWLAKANVYAALAGLVISLPLYYFFGKQGIVPAIIVTAAATFAVQYIFARKVAVKVAAVSVREALQQGKGMLKLGFMLSLSGLITVAVSYLVRIMISHLGGVEAVGFYNAGFAIIGTYVGLVFAAMGTDYYPRLAAVHKNIQLTNELIRQQSEIALMILTPLIVFFLVFIDWITVLLYSEKFLPISAMVHWAVLGILFKGVSWSVAFLILAKGESKAFFYNELAANLYILVFNVAGYYYMGLEGLGISFLMAYLVYFIQVYLFCKYYYHMNLPLKFFGLLSGYLLLGIAAFTLSYIMEGWAKYLVGSVLVVVTVVISMVLLNQRVQFVEILKTKFKK